MHFDAHEKPPSYLRDVFKQYRNKRAEDLVADAVVYDSQTLEGREGITPVDWVLTRDASNVFSEYMGHDVDQGSCSNIDHAAFKRGFRCDSIPHLLVVPNAIPIAVQRELLKRTFHRDLSNPKHQTNVNLHHHLSYPAAVESFFKHSPEEASIAIPKDPLMHKPMTVGQLLHRKLRWITLGGQYDWTNKVYPSQEPPGFPPDLSKLLQGIFPETQPEAAIVNLYSPGDTLSMHRDVSEESDRGLVSISIGCDALFVIGMDPATPNGNGDHMVIRLRSGDAVYMAGPSRFGWHGVPCIIPNTCPQELCDWPCTGLSDGLALTIDEGWRGWMSKKRINLNVRQMKD